MSPSFHLSLSEPIPLGRVDKWTLEKIRDHQPDVVLAGMMPYISGVSYEWVRDWADAISDPKEDRSIGMKEMDSRVVLDAYLARTFFRPKFGSGYNLYGNDRSALDMLIHTEGYLNGALIDSKRFTPNNQRYAFLFILTKVDPKIVMSWDEVDMSKLVRYVIAGFPHDTLLAAYKNGIDIDIMLSLGDS